MPTIRDIAKYAGVSTATVSRILNNDEYFVVKKETKEKVLLAVKKLKYIKKDKRKKVVQLNVSLIKVFDEKIESDDPYFISLRMSLETVLKSKGIKIKNFELNSIETDSDVVINLITSDAIVIIGEIREKQLKYLKSINKNIICVDAYNKDNSIDYIKFDMRHSVEIVIDYLLKLGHKKIALLVGRNQIVRNLVDFREKYFIEIMKELNLYNEKYVIVDEF